MPSQWDAPNLVLAALAATLAQRLGNALAIKVGWVGNEPLFTAEGSAVLSLESADPRRDVAPALITSTTPPPNGSHIGTAVLDYGSLLLPITANLYVSSARRGKTLRAEKLALLESAFDIAEGQEPHLALTLDDGISTTAWIVLSEVTIMDEPEGISKSEWRAILRFDARVPLRTARSLPFCDDIVLQTDTGPYSVTHVIDAAGTPET